MNASFPLAVGIDTGANKIYVASYVTNNITVIDGRTNTTLTVSDPNEQGPRCIAVNSKTHKIYVGNDISGNITVSDGATNTTLTVSDPNESGPFAAGVNQTTNGPQRRSLYRLFYADTSIKLDLRDGVSFRFPGTRRI